MEERLRQEEEGKFLFSSQTIYVRKILEGAAGDAAADGGKENGKGYNYDPEFSAPVRVVALSSLCFLTLRIVSFTLFWRAERC